MSDLGDERVTLAHQARSKLLSFERFSWRTAAVREGSGRVGGPTIREGSGRWSFTFCAKKFRAKFRLRLHVASDGSRLSLRLRFGISDESGDGLVGPPGFLLLEPSILLLPALAAIQRIELSCLAPDVTPHMSCCFRPLIGDQAETLMVDGNCRSVPEYKLVKRHGSIVDRQLGGALKLQADMPPAMFAGRPAERDNGCIY